MAASKAPGNPANPSGAPEFTISREVLPPERIVFINSFSDEKGITADPWMPDWPNEVLNIVTFTEHDGHSTVPMRGTPINATEAQCNLFERHRDSMENGFAGTFAQLDEFRVAGEKGRAS